MAAGDNFPFRGYVVSLFDQGTLHGMSGLPVDWDTDTIKVAFLTAAPDYDTATTDIHWDDVSASEVSSAGTYAAGGIALAGKAVTWDTDTVKIDATDTTVVQDSGSGFTNATWAVIYKDTGTPSTSPLLVAIDLGGTVGNTTADYVLQWGANGILRGPITDGT